MSRRPLMLLSLALATLTVAACSNPTEPKSLNPTISAEAQEYCPITVGGTPRCG